MNQRSTPLNPGNKALDLWLDHIQVAAAVTDLSGAILVRNETFRALIDDCSWDIAGLPVTGVVPSAETIRDWLSAFGEHSDASGELPIVRLRGRNGGELTSRCAVLRVACGQTSYCCVLFIDIHAMEGPCLLQRFSDSFMRDVNLGVILINIDFRLVDISDMACRVLGLVREEVVNKPLDEVFAAVPIDHQLVQRTILDGHIVRNHAFSWTNHEDRYELLMDSNVLKDADGKIVGAYVIFKDVTNLRSLEEQVQRSDRLAMIGQIAAGTAHEIRNPLTSIRGFLQVLKKTFRDNNMEKEYGYTEIMLTEIDRINQLVSEFLLLSKPKNICYEPIDISMVLREILPIIHSEAILHGVAVEYEPSPHMPKVLGDREMFKQVCLNISKNGIEAMSEGGLLHIVERVDFSEQKVNIDIQDTGPGIPSFLMDKIFDPFFTTKENGTGLGLSVCQRIVHDLGGSIRVSSKGFGTTFTISVPFSSDHL